MACTCRPINYFLGKFILCLICQIFCWVLVHGDIFKSRLMENLYALFHISFHLKSQGFHQVGKWVTWETDIWFKCQFNLRVNPGYGQHQNSTNSFFVYFSVKIYLYITAIYVHEDYYCYTYMLLMKFTISRGQESKVCGFHWNILYISPPNSIQRFNLCPM